MNNVTLGSTGITVPQNAFGALPIQRISYEAAAALMMRAYNAGMRFYDTARAYSDSEEKMGRCFEGMREKIYIATKTGAKTPEAFWADLETSLRLLKTDYVDIYQFHCADVCYKPGDGTGMYEAMLKAKAQGKVRHIGLTAHKIEVAFECVRSGLYETLQYPLSYLASPREEELVRLCEANNMGFIAMKGLAGGLLTNSRACMAYMAQFPNVVPIWGIQREEELDQWLSFFDECPVLDEETCAFIEEERRALDGRFCRGCGYCEPCPEGIQIHQAARISLMIRRAPTAAWTNDYWQAEMRKVENCRECKACMKRCPYGLPIPELLRKNYEDYKLVVAGKRAV